MRRVVRRGPGWGEHLRWSRTSRLERGLLLVLLAPAALALEGMAGASPLRWGLAAQAAGACAIALGGLLLRPRPGLARLLCLLGIGANLAAIAPLVLLEPELLVLAALAVWAIAQVAFDEPAHAAAASRAPPRPARTARLASIVVLAVWFLELVLGESGGAGRWSMLASFVVATLLAVRWAWTDRASRRAVALLVIAIASVAAAATLAPSPDAAYAWLGAVPIATLVLAPREGGGFLDRALVHPARLLVVTFLGLCALGGVVLALPAASQSGASIGILDALFTSTSAVCVTGLIVLDTPNVFSLTGQIGIAALIQVGGLGIMTFYTVALAALGQRLSLRHERAVAGAVNVEDRRRLIGSLRRVLVLTLVSEALGALVLYGAFLYEAALRHRPLAEVAGAEAWRAVFTSISAFCNAGFALQTDSLVPYQHNPVVLYTVGALIVVGGLSPAAVVAIPRWMRRQPIGLPERFMLTMAAALLLSGTVLYAGIEWSASLDGLSWIDRIHNAAFQSITLRTAGFNSVDLTQTRPATQTLMIVYMLVGGSPGGTAGGIKTTTVAVILAMLAATIRGQESAEAYGRRLGRTTIFKAAAVVTVGVAALLTALVAMQLTQPIALDLAAFEVASALGTVGLSLGATGLLDGVGKIIIMACMFAGRVGPLTLFLFLSEQQQDVPVQYPEEEVDVG